MQEPGRFQDLLPYDYFDNFRPIGVGGSNKRDKLGQQIATQPLSSGITLNDLRSMIGRFLTQNNIIDSKYNYIVDAVWGDGMLRKLVADPTLRPLLEYFETHIKRRLNNVSLAPNPSCSGNADEDFDVSAIPPKYLEKKPTLIAFNNFFSAQARKYLNIELIIKFYDKNNSSTAHAMQGQYEGSPRVIAFNLAGSPFQQFELMVQTKIWNQEHYLNIIDSMTHELVHSFEPKNSSTHNQAFFEHQERFLQAFFSISEEDILEWHSQLFSNADLDATSK